MDVEVIDETQHITEISEEDAQEFFACAQYAENHCSRLRDELEGDSLASIEEDRGSLDPPDHDITPASNPLLSNLSSRILSEEENQEINDKIDRLVEAIGRGRQLTFVENEQNGGFDIFSEPESQASGTEDTLEAGIAASPNNYGNIIRRVNGRSMVRSEDSVDSAQLESVPTSGTNAWERKIAAANVRYALRSLKPENTYQMGEEILEEAVKDGFGRYVPFVGRKGLEMGKVSHIPLDFNRRRGTKTPSIHSNGSKLDDSSPLFERSTPAWIHDPNDQSSESSSSDTAVSDIQTNGSSILAWLESLESPERLALPDRKIRADRAFRVLNDRTSAHESAEATHVLCDNPAAKALKDVSNLRRAGYLSHNSFADTKRAAAGQQPIPPHRFPPPIFTRAIDPASRRGFTSSGMLGSLPRPRADVIPELNGGHQVDSTSLKSPSSDPDRAAHCELALSSLEGRALPGQYSPLKRYADYDGGYRSSIKVEHPSWHINEPVPLRPAAGNSDLGVEARLQVRRGRSILDDDAIEEGEIGYDAQIPRKSESK